VNSYTYLNKSEINKYGTDENEDLYIIFS